MTAISVISRIQIPEGGPTGGLRIWGSKIQNPEPGLGDSAWESRGQDHRSKIQGAALLSGREQAGMWKENAESRQIQNPSRAWKVRVRILEGK